MTVITDTPPTEDCHDLLDRVFDERVTTWTRRSRRGGTVSAQTHRVSRRIGSVRSQVASRPIAGRRREGHRVGQKAQPIGYAELNQA